MDHLDRAVPGHCEGDLIIGLQRSAIGTLVERTTRFTMLVHLPRAEGYGIAPNEERSCTRLLRRDRDEERTRRDDDRSARAAAPVVDLGPRQGALGPRGLPGRDQHPGLLRRPAQPRQRGTNENTNGLLRQCFPKGTDLSRWSAEEIQAVANALNHRPRKTLSWRTPAETFDEHLRSLQQAGVATSCAAITSACIRRWDTAHPTKSRTSGTPRRAIALSVRGCGGVGFEVRHAERGDGAGTAQPR